MQLPIVIYPDKILTRESQNVDLDFIISNEARELGKNIIETMYKADGVGLAAPQIGRGIKMCVIAKEHTNDKTKDLILFNPIWIKLSKKSKTDVEGCLSVPKTFGSVKRYTDIKVEALDENGKQISFEAHDFFARIIQHEVDHLNGIIFLTKAKHIHTEDKNAL